MSSPKIQFDLLPDYAEAAPVPGSAAALKQQVADRLAAHRFKRTRQTDANVVPIPNLEPTPSPVRVAARTAIVLSHSGARPSATKPGNTRANQIAAAVAQRYANSTTYREFLAAEAERAISQANATAEIATRNAKAITAVQQQLLAELDLWADPTPSEPEVDSPAIDCVPHSSQSLGRQSDEWVATEPSEVTSPAIIQQPFSSGLTVRLYEDVGPRPPEARIACIGGTQDREVHDDEAINHLSHLDDEIAFRHDPVFDEPATPPVPIPANLLEFPRQLVAARKSRPRIAEGPLREEADTAPTAAQLRIFEVDAAQFSTAPTAEPETSLPEWSSIHLGATPIVQTEAQDEGHAQTFAAWSSEAQLQTALYVPIQVAPLGLRFMAAAVDACLLGATFLVGVTAFAYAENSLPRGPVALIATAATLLVLFVLYHMLFFTLSCATPGMRYARIGLCTFSDDNPTRTEMRRRVWFVLLAACPLGLGILWSLLDEDSLGWHDRLSRIYQRSY